MKRRANRRAIPVTATEAKREPVGVRPITTYTAVPEIPALMKVVFTDTFYWIAIAMPEDPWSEAVARVCDVVQGTKPAAAGGGVLRTLAGR